MKIKLDIQDAEKKIKNAIANPKTEEILLKLIPDGTNISSNNIALVREALGLPKLLCHQTFSNSAEYPIEYVLKIRLAHFIISANDAKLELSTVRTILNMTEGGLNRLAYDKISKMALALDDHFVQKKFKVQQLRELLSLQMPGIEFSKSGLLKLNQVQINSLAYCLVKRCKVTTSQLCSIFGIAKSDAELVGIFMKK